MNPLVQAQLRRLHQNLDALKVRQEEQSATLAAAQEEAQRHLRRLLQREGERVTLQVNQAQYQDLLDRLHRMEAVHQSLRQHAESMDRLADALAESLEP